MALPIVDANTLFLILLDGQLARISVANITIF